MTCHYEFLRDTQGRGGTPLQQERVQPNFLAYNTKKHCLPNPDDYNLCFYVNVLVVKGLLYTHTHRESSGVAA